MDRSQRLLTNSQRLMLLFVATYLTHGFATQFGLIAQPLQFFMMTDLHMNAAQVSFYLAWMMLPWFLEGFYGVFCDFVPLSRKTQLLAANLLSVGAFACIAYTNSLSVVVAALVLNAIGMATSIAITAGLAVTRGRCDGNISSYLTVQMICLYGAMIASSLGGGWLCQHLSAKSALHYAGAVSAFATLLTASVVIGTLHDEKPRLSRQELLQTWDSLKRAYRMPSLRFTALFIGCWCFSPSFGVSLYFYESNTLGFSQSDIGQLAAWNAFGMLAGAALYLGSIKRKALDRQLRLAVILGTISTLCYLLLANVASAIGLELFRGMANMVALLAIRAVAAIVCPKHVEVAVMASLFAVWDLSTDLSTYIGGYLFTWIFHNRLAPLIVVAACTTAFCGLLVRLFSNITHEVP